MCSGTCELYKANVFVGDAAMLVCISDVENTPITKAANSVEQSPCHGACSYGQIIACILHTWIFHYSIYHSPQLAPIMSQINPVQALPSSSFNIHFNIIKCTPGSFSGLFPSGLFHHKTGAFLFCL